MDRVDSINISDITNVIMAWLFFAQLALGNHTIATLPAKMKTNLSVPYHNNSKNQEKVCIVLVLNIFSLFVNTTSATLIYIYISSQIKLKKFALAYSR